MIRFDRKKQVNIGCRDFRIVKRERTGFQNPYRCFFVDGGQGRSDVTAGTCAFVLEQMFANDALEPIQVWARQIAFYGKRLMSIDTDVIHGRESEMNRDMTKRTLHYQFCASVVRRTCFPTHGQDVTSNMEFELTADSVGQMQPEVTGSVFPYSLDLTAAVSKYL